MKRIAIISLFHLESSLCLAKGIANQGVKVDFYFIADMISDQGKQPGISYAKASILPGITRLTEQTSPEIHGFTQGLDITYHIIRIVSLNKKAEILNKFIFKQTLGKIKGKKYDAIHLIGQWRWIDYMHDILKGENLIHTFHEVGDHQKGVASNPLMELVIKDRSKVILLSESTYTRFMSIPGAEDCTTTMIPMGPFHSLLLFQKEVDMGLSIDLSKTTFLFYGFLKEYKGLSLLKDAHSILTPYHDCYNMIIAGSGKDDTLPFFESQNNVQVINRYLSDEEMIHLNKISDVVVLPYKSASQTGIVPTSFMLGNAVIATKIGALTEVVQDNVNGLLVEPDDAQGFAAAMLSLIKDKDKLKNLRLNASRFGHGDVFDWDNIAQSTLSFYGV